MVNFELSVNNLKQRIKGIKLPGSLEELRHTVNYGKTTVEVPISGIPNSAVVLEVLGKSDTPKLVLENGEEVDLLEDGSVNVKPVSDEHKESTTSEDHKAETRSEDPKASEGHTVTPTSGEDTAVVASGEHTATPTNEEHAVSGERLASDVATSSEVVSATGVSEERSASSDTEERREPALSAGGVRPSLTEGDHI